MFEVGEGAKEVGERPLKVWDEGELDLKKGDGFEDVLNNGVGYGLHDTIMQKDRAHFGDGVEVDCKGVAQYTPYTWQRLCGQPQGLNLADHHKKHARMGHKE